MLADVRRTEIVAIVARERVARVADLAELLGVSVVTVRRDIDALEDAGLVQKIHGGAKLPGGAGTHEPGFELKSTQGTQEKNAIAQAALQLVQDGMAIGLSAGTTTWALAKALSSRKNLTVVTNSVKIADVFQAAGSRASVILTGGERTPSDALVGPLSVAALRRLHVDWLLMGVHGMDAEAGFTTPNLAEAETNRALVASARRVAVVADNSKWGVVGLSTIASLSEVDVVVSDGGLQPDARQVLESSCGRVVLAA